MLLFKLRIQIASVVSGSCEQIRWKHIFIQCLIWMWNEQRTRLHLTSPILWSERNQFPMDYIYFERRAITVKHILPHMQAYLLSLLAILFQCYRLLPLPSFSTCTFASFFLFDFTFNRAIYWNGYVQGFVFHTYTHTHTHTSDNV